MKTTESIAEIIIEFVLIAAILAGLFSAVVWFTFDSLLLTGIVWTVTYAIGLSCLFGSYVHQGGDHA